MTDQRKLVAAVLADDRKAFTELVRQHQRLVSHIVFRLVPGGADREDICQEVFIKVYRNLKGFRFDSKLSTWIGRIAYNVSLNFLDKKKIALYDDLSDEDRNYEPVDETEPTPDQIFEDSERSLILRREIENLPPVYRTIVTLFHLDEMSYAEIGRITKMPEGTIKSYLFRARRRLRENLARKYQREEL